MGVSLRVNSDRREKLSFEPSFSMDNVGALGWGWRAGVAVSYRPSSRVEIVTEPSYQRQPDAAQYVAATADVGYAPTFRRRYIFGELDRRTFSLDIRLNVTFSRDLTLQLFTQPLLSVGDYTAYKQFTQPRTFDFDTFEEGAAVTGPSGVSCVGGRTCRSGNRRLVNFDGDGTTEFSFGERDFRVRSLRGNAVLRWEYRPGSTLFFVWQQRRSYQDLEANTFRLGGEALDLLTDPPANVFIIKANYWLSLTAITNDRFGAPEAVANSSIKLARYAAENDRSARRGIGAGVRQRLARGEGWGHAVAKARRVAPLA